MRKIRHIPLLAFLVLLTFPSLSSEAGEVETLTRTDLVSASKFDPDRPSFYIPNSTAEIPGVVPAGSTFQDENPSYPVAERFGTSAIVESSIVSKNHQLVLTAAHLVDGKDPWVLVGGKKVRALDFLIDADNDQALLRIPRARSEVPALKYDSKSDELRVSRNFQKLNRDFRISSLFQDGSDLHTPLVLWSNLGSESYPRGYVGNTDGKTVSSAARVVSWGDQIKTPSRSAEGQSGAFLYGYQSGKVYGVLGQSNYFFRESFYSSPQALKRLFRAYSQGRRGHLTQSRFKMRNSLPYRDFGDGISEATFSDRSTGKGVYGDPGKGVYGDPGKGVYGDPGKGVYCDPAVQNLANLSPTNLEAVQAVLRGQDFQGPKTTPDAGAIFERYGLRPGILWHGKSVIAIQAFSHKNEGRTPDLVLLANAQSVKFIREHADRFRFVPVENGSDLVELATLRGGDSKLTIPKHEASSACHNGLTHMEDMSLERDSAGIKIRLLVSARTKSSLPDGRVVSLGCEIEPLVISLDRNGAVAGQEHFLPIVQVRGAKSGQTYDVDLRDVFFRDLSSLGVALRDPLFDANGISQQIDDVFLRELNRTAGRIQIPVRNHLTGDEHVYEFNR